MKIILGLGNPGTQYERTRHNIGWAVLDELARRHSIAIAKKQCEARVGDGILLFAPEVPALTLQPGTLPAPVQSEKILLAKPQTFMNLSGRSAQALLKFYGCTPGDLLVVGDDLNLPLGKLRLRAGGSDGGHNGLKSITLSIGTLSYARLRFGVGEPPARERAERGTADFVLRPFAPPERDEVDLGVQRAADCVELWARSGTEAAANRFNG
jgi:PTH1 family peptidyl-tRNA hydrolase